MYRWGNKVEGPTCTEFKSERLSLMDAVSVDCDLRHRECRKGIIATYACVRKSSAASQLGLQKETCRLKKCLPVTWSNQDESLACSKVVGSTFGPPGFLSKFHSWIRWTQEWILSSWIAGAVCLLYSRDRVSIFWQRLWDESVAKEHVSCWNSSSVCLPIRWCLRYKHTGWKQRWFPTGYCSSFEVRGKHLIVPQAV